MWERKIEGEKERNIKSDKGGRDRDKLSRKYHQSVDPEGIPLILPIEFYAHSIMNNIIYYFSQAKNFN